MHDPNTVRRIVRTAGSTPDDVVLEVGPGLGSLTLALLPARRARARRRDRPGARRRAAGDRRRHAPARTPAGCAVHRRGRAADRRRRAGRPAPTALVANLPYNVAVPVVLHLLAELPTLRHGLVMVQTEVADRLVAGPGSKVYGVPSVKLAWYAQARAAGKVPPNVFWPVPNVDSGLVAFTRREPPPRRRTAGSGSSRSSTRRSRSAARRCARRWPAGPAAPDRAAEALTAAGVDPGARGGVADRRGVRRDRRVGPGGSRRHAK